MEGPGMSLFSKPRPRPKSKASAKPVESPAAPRRPTHSTRATGGAPRSGARSKAAKRRAAEEDFGSSGSDTGSDSEDSEADSKADTGSDSDASSSGDDNRKALDVHDGSPSAADFSELGLSNWLVHACDLMGIRKPTPVQSVCIPKVLEGHDVMGCSPTGSGKTAAFGLPILEILGKDPYGIFAIILTPGRELALQIADQLAAFGAPMKLRLATVIGGLDMTQQALELQRRPHVVVATPGRLADHISRGASMLRLQHLKFVVLDEADRLLDITIAPDVARILDALPKKRQTLLFSATMTDDLQRLNQLARKPFRWSYDTKPGTVASLSQYYVFLPSQTKPSMLAHILRTYGPESAAKGGKKRGAEEAAEETATTRADSIIIFVATCYGAQLLTETLTELEILCVGLHSKISQRRRMAALGKFKSGVAKVLVATDVASRGLDIPSVELVINYDVPRVPVDYIHRVGRTARAGRGGRAVTFVTQHDISLLHAIEAKVGIKLTEFEDADADAALAIMGKVTTARQVARMRLMETGFEEQVLRDKQRKLESRKRQAAFAEAASGAQPTESASGSKKAKQQQKKKKLKKQKNQQRGKEAAVGSGASESGKRRKKKRQRV